MNFAVNSVEYSVDPNEDVCATGKKDWFQQPTVFSVVSSIFKLNFESEFS
jgi:hypothetical protein